MQLNWYTHLNYWTDAIASEYGDAKADKYTYPVGLEAYRVRHTLPGVVVDIVGAVVDRKRERSMLIAFPAYLGPTVGAVLPGSEGDPNKRAKASAAELSLAAQAGLNRLEMIGPDNAKWIVYTKEVRSDNRELFDGGGSNLSPAGRGIIEGFVADVLTACGEWTFRTDAQRDRISELVVEATAETVVKLQ
jgi:hypothetical protein